MSGLILAGLGQGISNAATSVGNMMMRQNEEDRRDAREEARDTRRMQAEENKLEARRQQMISEIAAAREGGAQIGRERMAGQVLARSGSQMAGGRSPVMDQAEFANILRDNPEYEQLYRQAGLVSDAMDPRMQRATDQYEAALGAGASSATLEGLEKAKKSVLDTIREENREKRDRARDEQFDRRQEQQQQQFMASLNVRQQQADASTARAERLPASQDPKRPLTSQDLQRRVDGSSNLLATELGVPKNNINGMLATLRRRADNGNADAQARLREIEPLIRDYNLANQEMANFRRADSANPGDNTRTQSGPGTLPEPKSRAELEELAPGTRYKAPDGTIRTKS